jgi:hypothetical protein
MRRRDERFEGQAKYKNKPDTLYDKQAAGKSKPIKRFTPQGLLLP